MDRGCVFFRVRGMECDFRIQLPGHRNSPSEVHAKLSMLFESQATNENANAALCKRHHVNNVGCMDCFCGVAYGRTYSNGGVYSDRDGWNVFSGNRNASRFEVYRNPPNRKHCVGERGDVSSCHTDTD